MIIGLGHRARSGKDTVADYLVEHYGFKKTFFAERLKDACRIIFNLNDEQLYGELKETPDKFWNDTPRRIQQLVGTECMRRGYADDVWVRGVKLTMEMSPHPDWVISDVRFPNEGKAIKSWGGNVIKVNRPSLPPIARMEPKWWQKLVGMEGPMHASESSMLNYRDWDFTLQNDGTLEELYAKVDELMKELGREKRTS